MTKMEIGKAPLTYAICQILVILFFGLFSTFGDSTNPQGNLAYEDPSSTAMLKDHYASF